MVAIKGLLFCSKNYFELFKGQDWNFHGAALADGLLWVCKIWERSAVLVGLLENLFYFWIEVFYRAGISSSACNYVELLPQLDINVMSSICAS